MTSITARVSICQLKAKLARNVLARLVCAAENVRPRHIDAQTKEITVL
jgi:hypothetical protein